MLPEYLGILLHLICFIYLVKIATMICLILNVFDCSIVDETVVLDVYSVVTDVLCFSVHSWPCSAGAVC